MLNNRYVRTVIFSRVLLNLGIWVRNFAILLYVTEVTHNDALYVSLISVVEYAPIFLFSMIGGTFADRWKPRRTMIWCDFLSAFSVLAVLLVLLLGSWQALLFATFISAMLSQFSQPSAMKLFKQHVAADQLQSVMAMFQSLIAFFMVIGPVIGAFIYQQYGIMVSVAVMIALFFGSALILTRLPRDPDEAAPPSESRFVRELADGFRYVGANRALRTLGGMFAASGLASGLIQPLMLYVATDNLGQDKLFMQWLLMANGAAMLIGGGVIMAVAKKAPPHALLAAGLLISAVGTLGVGLSSSPALTMALQVLNGLGYPCIHIGIQMMIIRNSEGAYIGRVGGVLMPMFMGMMVIGMGVAGPLKRASSLFSVFTLASVLFLLSILILLPLFGKREKRESAAQAADIPKVKSKA